MKVAGLDYSMTSPAICLYDDADGEFKFSNCSVYFLTQTKKYDTIVKNITGNFFEYTDDITRYDKISHFFLEKIVERNVKKIFIEGYSMGSKGRVFNIAENTGVMKYRLWKNGIDYEIIPPTVIKKFATGKGNADKAAMQSAFMKDNNVDLKFEFKMTENQWNPSSDIIDSYWICKYGYESENEKQQRKQNG